MSKDVASAGHSEARCAPAPPAADQGGRPARRLRSQSGSTKPTSRHDGARSISSVTSIYGVTSRSAIRKPIIGIAQTASDLSPCQSAQFSSSPSGSARRHPRGRAAFANRISGDHHPGDRQVRSDRGARPQISPISAWWRILLRLSARRGGDRPPAATRTRRHASMAARGRDIRPSCSRAAQAEWLAPRTADGSGTIHNLARATDFAAARID